MSRKPNILLLSYKFPPYEGVGARRWALFYNEFRKHNVNLFVVCYAWPDKHNSYKLTDTKFVYRLKDPITYFINYRKIFSKQLNLLGYLLMKLFKVSDEARFFYRYNFTRIRKIIERNKIDCIIATGGPFSSNYFGAKLKELYPTVKLVQEFRDTWTQDYFWEYPERKDLNDKEYLRQVAMEKYSVNSADTVVTVCPGYLDRIRQTHKNNTSLKYIIVENGYDLNDIAENRKVSKKFPEKYISIVHFGTLSFGRDKEFFNFLNSVKYNLKDRRIKFYQYGKIDDSTFKLIQEDDKLSEIVSFEKAVSPEEMHLLMAECDIHLVVNDIVFYYTMGSKFYDALLHKKPILLISKNSTLSELVISYHLGWHTDNSDEMNHKVISTLVALDDLENFSYSKDFNVFKYSVQSRALEYLELINKLF